MKRIVITGANGTIGRVLRKGLSRCEITALDLPKDDIKDYEKLLEKFHGHHVIVHLAWDTKTESYISGKSNPDNKIMFQNVYRAALETRVSRVVMASSVHIHDFYKWNGPGLITTEIKPIPNTPYGESKALMENLGRDYGKQGLEVICIRFGGVKEVDSPPVQSKNHKTWLSHQDCVSLVETCIEAPEIPNNFLIIHGVSNYPGRIHDYSNPLGCVPTDQNRKIYKPTFRELF